MGLILVNSYLGIYSDESKCVHCTILKYCVQPTDEGFYSDLWVYVCVVCSARIYRIMCVVCSARICRIMCVICSASF